jgi:hypothetical protein
VPREEDDDRPRRRRDEDEDEDDAPRRKRRDDDEDDERDEERPRRRRRDDDDEDDDRPRRKRRRDEDDEDDDYDDERGGRKRLSRDKLRSIAGYQKGIIFCILGYLALYAAVFAVPPDLKLWVALAIIPVGIAATVFVFLLATTVYSTGTGVLYAILTLIPCIGLIMLLVINGKATTILKENGIRVGLLGANSSDL